MPDYRFTLKSEELRGAGQPNIVQVHLASDADAAIFAANLEIVYAADCVSTDLNLANNYALPYPAGTSNTARFAMFDGTGGWYNTLMRNWASASDPTTVAAQLITDGILLPNYLVPAASINIRVVQLTESVP